MMKKSTADSKTKGTGILTDLRAYSCQGKDAEVLFALNYLNYQPIMALDVIQVINSKKYFSKVISVLCMCNNALGVRVDDWQQC